MCLDFSCKSAARPVLTLSLEGLVTCCLSRRDSSGEWDVFEQRDTSSGELLTGEHPPSHARVYEGVAKSHFPLKAVVFKSQKRTRIRFRIN